MTLRGSLLLALVATTVVAVLIGLLYGLRDGAITWILLAPPGAAALAFAHAAATHRSRLGSLSRQFRIVAAVAVGQLLVSVAAGAGLMFVSTHDALLALAIVALAGLIALRAAQLFAGQVLGDVEALRDTLVGVGAGTREPAPLPASQDELAELTRAANATISRLADTEGARRDLIAAVSHDLRTPLTSLRLLAEAVEDEVVTGETRAQYLKEMRGHVGALSGLIDDLFELSRLEAGDVHWTLEHIRLDDLLAETIRAMRPQADASNVRVRATPGGTDAAAHGNLERVQRVLFNLIQNAIRHTPADGSITVLAETAEAEVVIEVADTGPGIPSTERGRVFEPFFRGGEDAARTGDGAGLGLAIARAIVEAHGGRIWLEDSEAGTRVRFSLPRGSVVRP